MTFCRLVDYALWCCDVSLQQPNHSLVSNAGKMLNHGVIPLNDGDFMHENVSEDGQGVVCARGNVLFPVCSVQNC
jgi:hypothetical protein